MRSRAWRRSSPGAIVLLFILGAVARQWSHGTHSSGAAPIADAKILRGPVTRVVDGDTIHVELAGSLTPIEKIRLLRINTPERDQPGYERATAALKALVEGRDVELVFEKPGIAERDEYGRLLAYVLLDGRNVNVEMVRGGWTRFFTKYGEGRLADDFRAAEREAREQQRGLWSADGWNAPPTAGSESKKRHR